MADIITTLHPHNDESINLYPNIKKVNIPNGSIDTYKLDSNVLSLIGSLKPSGTDTSANILAFASNKGIYVGTDTGDWYYWDGTQYVSGGTYQATSISDDSVLLSQLASETIKAFGFSQISTNYNIGTIATNNGTIDNTNTRYLYTDLIPVTSLLYVRLLQDVLLSNNFTFVIFKYELGGSYIGYADATSVINMNYNKVLSYDNINVRIRINYDDYKDFSNQAYYDFVVNRLALYTNNYYNVTGINNKFTEVINDINNKKIIYNKPKFYNKESYYVPSNIFDYNTNLQSRINVNISRNGHKWGTDFNISEHMISNASGVTVYMSSDGDDTNNGLTNATPKLTLASCLAVSNVDTIIIESGIYYSGIHFTANQSINTSVNIICNEYAYFVNGDKITTVTDLGNGYYHIPNGSNGSPRFIIDIETGKNLTDVGSTLNMPYYTVYKGSSACIVRLPYIPDSNKLIRTHNGNPLNFTSSCYIQNISFIGGYQALNITLNDEDIYFKYCKFEYARNNGLKVVGGNTYLYRCEASYNYLDGFNYHTNNTYVPCCLEIECCGYYNGYLNSDNTSYSNNGSTIHYGGKAIRLNCNYSYCKGGVIADHTAYSYNFGCTANNSICYVTGYETNNACIHCIATSTMYLYDCVLYGSTYELSMVDGGGTINTNITYNKIYQEDASEVINIIN